MGFSQTVVNTKHHRNPSERNTVYEQLKLDNQICFRLYAASRLLTQAYTPLLMPLKLTYPQYLVLMVLWEKDNQLVSDISHQMMLESNTLTPLLQRMEREGLVVRTKGIADGRQTLVSLTKKGQRLQEQCKDIPECMAAHIGNGNISLEQATNLKGTLDALIKTLR